MQLSIKKDSVRTLFPPVGQIHSDEDEDGAHEEPDGDLLAENPPGEKNRYERIQVDIVRGHDGAELVHHPRPSQEAGHRGDAAEEEQVEQDVAATEHAERRCLGEEKEIGMVPSLKFPKLIQRSPFAKKLIPWELSQKIYDKMNMKTDTFLLLYATKLIFKA